MRWIHKAFASWMLHGTKQVWKSLLVASQLASSIYTDANEAMKQLEVPCPVCFINASTVGGCSTRRKAPPDGRKPVGDNQPNYGSAPFLNVAEKSRMKARSQNSNSTGGMSLTSPMTEVTQILAVGFLRRKHKESEMLLGAVSVSDAKLDVFSEDGAASETPTSSKRGGRVVLRKRSLSKGQATAGGAGKET